MTDPNEDTSQGVYLIGDEIEFYSDSHLLRSRNGQKEHTLFSTASRCLEMLLLNHGTTIPKYDLMTFAWREHGLNVSANTFYQNISSLRKAIAEFLPDEDIIVTVKRAGLLIPLTIEIIKIEEQTETSGNVADNCNHDSAENNDYLTSGQQDSSIAEVAVLPNAVANATLTRKKYRWSQLWLGVMLLALIGLAYRVINHNREKNSQEIPFQNYVLYKRLDSHCKIYVNPDAGRIDTTNKYLNIKASECKGYESIYVTLFEGSVKSSALYCSIKEKKYISCISEYFARNQK
ncbi:winged helix-turn-helix domain-containing protein [Erwinia piriflorinigrans]|uniref:Protein rcaC n=1 Tax=Erwinia piriflorinigrans CFBP 5888 TaxID=1161919 RepID=V5ZAY7_9GAMM|nr:winged helix-turn-helix domain-containing protein [Erwinia piriflorinigrans]CCG88528.1 Protein rcaC [Erwinia piriflorinigrans CFBP 5888]